MHFIIKILFLFAIISSPDASSCYYLTFNISYAKKERTMTEKNIILFILKDAPPNI